MRVLISDLAYQAGASSMGVGAQWVAWRCRTEGLDTSNTAAGCSVALLSSVSPIDAPKLARMRLGMPMIVGGAGALSPASYIRHGATGVVVGDGTRFLKTLAHDGLDCALALPNVMTKQNHAPVVDGAFDFSCPVFTSEDGTRRIIIGRGCKHKCLFCHTSWSVPNAEHQNHIAIEKIARGLVLRGDRVGYITNDMAMHPWARKLPPSVDASFSVDYLRKTGMPSQRQIRIGVEGVSERLRRYVNKPITRADLVKCTAWLNAGGRSVRWFLIAGLPTETDADWDELRDTVQEWKRMTPKGVLALSFTAWCPDPSTPLAVMPMTDDYWPRVESFREWFFGGQGWSNRVKLMFPQQPKSRLAKAMLAMDATERQLRSGGAQGGNAHVAYPFASACNAIRERLHAAQA